MSHHEIFYTRKSNPFHGFLNGLKQCVYTGFHAINILPRKNSTAFQLNDLNFYLYAAQKMKPSFEYALSQEPFAHILTPPYDPLYMRNSLLRTSQLCNPSTKTLQYGLQYNPSLSQVLSPLGHPLKPFLGTPWGCPVRRSGDIVLYIITTWAYLANIYPLFYWLKIILINQESILVYKKGSKILQRFLA